MGNLYAYKQGSKSAKNLAEALGVKRIRHNNSNYVGRKDKKVINWGATELPNNVLASTVINPPEKVRNASNKKLFFQIIEGKCSHPDYTTDTQVAKQWIKDGFVVVARTVLAGNSGKGIVLAAKEEELVDAPLYTKYVKKKDEYRIHIMNGEVIDMQRKARRLDAKDEDIDWRIRNHDNGFIFMRGGIEVPKSAIEEAKKAMELLGLDFGAVDIIFNQHENKAYVLEINTAPGLEGTTLDNYVKAFKGAGHA